MFLSVLSPETLLVAEVSSSGCMLRSSSDWSTPWTERSPDGTAVITKHQPELLFWVNSLIYSLKWAFNRAGLTSLMCCFQALVALISSETYNLPILYFKMRKLFLTFYKQFELLCPIQEGCWQMTIETSKSARSGKHRQA